MTAFDQVTGSGYDEGRSFYLREFLWFYIRIFDHETEKFFFTCLSCGGDSSSVACLSCGGDSSSVFCLS